MIRRSLGVAALIVTLLPSTPVRAAGDPPICRFSADTGRVRLSLPPQVAGAPPVVLSRLGEAIAVDGVACGGATVTSAETIIVTGVAEPTYYGHLLTIDLSGGPFAPGRTDEGDGSSEIEMRVDTGPSAGDVVTILGSSGPDVITRREAEVNLDAAADDVADVQLLALTDSDCGSGSDCWWDRLVIDTGGGPDRVVLDRINSPFTEADGGRGRDRLVAGSGRVHGGDGGDTMRNTWVAFLSGDGDNDLLVGVAGKHPVPLRRWEGAGHPDRRSRRRLPERGAAAGRPRRPRPASTGSRAATDPTS